MTDDELAVIEERANKAAPGPWHWEGDGYGEHAERCNHGTDWTGHGPDLMSTAATGSGTGLNGEPWTSFQAVISSYGHDAWGIDVDSVDAAFIACARTDIPALLAEVRRLRAVERIATDALEAIVENEDRGRTHPRGGTVAHAALIQMSVVE